MKMVCQRTFLISLFFGGAAAFSVPSSVGTNSVSALSATSQDESELSRRSFFAASAAAVAGLSGASAAQAVQEAETRQGIPVTAFNG